MNYFFRKIASKEQPQQVLAFCSHHQQSSNTLVIIDSRAINHFFTNKDLIINYRKYQHVFKTGLGEIVTANGYGNVILQLQLLDGSVNTLTISNVS